MGKSKRNRKKNKAAQPVASEVVAAPPTRETRPLSQTARVLMVLIIIGVLGIIIWLVRSSNRNIRTAQNIVGPPAGSGIQTGGSQSLAPTGSVDLQPTGSAVQAGGVQAGQSL